MAGMHEKRYADDKLFRFFWRTGDTDEGYGRDVADAFGRLGYGGGAIRALDYYREIAAPDHSQGGED